MDKSPTAKARNSLPCHENSSSFCRVNEISGYLEEFNQSGACASYATLEYPNLRDLELRLILPVVRLGLSGEKFILPDIFPKVPRIEPLPKSVLICTSIRQRDERGWKSNSYAERMWLQQAMVTKIAGILIRFIIPVLYALFGGKSNA